MVKFASGFIFGICIAIFSIYSLKDRIIESIVNEYVTDIDMSSLDNLEFNSDEFESLRLDNVRFLESIDTLRSQIAHESEIRQDLERRFEVVVEENTFLSEEIHQLQLDNQSLRESGLNIFVHSRESERY